MRTPSFTELYYNVGGHIANPALNPEELSAIEGGVKYTSNGICGSVSVYHNRYKNMIDWIGDYVDGKHVWRSVNFTRVNTIGVESNVRFAIQELLPHQNVLKSLNISYNYINQNKHDDGIETESKLEYLRHKLVAELQTHIIGNLDFGINYRFQKRNGNYIDQDGNTSKYHPYSLLDARLTWTGPSYTLYAQVNNLLNHKNYVDFGNLKQPGAWIVVGAKLHLNY